MDSIIQLHQIKKSYNREILKGIELTVYKQDYIAIIGKSGAGKSTLLNIIGLLEPYDSGYYYFKNQDLRTMKDASTFRFKHLGFIFQNYNLLENINVIDNITLPYVFQSFDYDEKYKEELLTLLQIQQIRNQLVHTLSGGEKQRVAIARALLLKPEVIIADEPTGNLDEENARIVFDVLKQLQKAGKTIILITHDLIKAKEADLIYELRDGELYEYQ